MLTARRIEILKAIVEEFIATAEPVGSKTLVDKYKLPYSSATIRNDMATLELMGYLEKPHTSAGRVPSNKGYQFYCEHLLQRPVEEEVKYALSNIFQKESMDVEDAIKESCKIISDMTNLTSGVLGPDASKQTLEHLKLFPIDDKTAVCIFITNLGHTENKIFNFPDAVSLEDIQTCTEILNDRLKGTAIIDLPERLEALRPILSENVKRHEMLFNAFAGAFVKFASETLYFQGTGNMLYQPEFHDIEKLKNFVKMLDDPGLWRNLGHNDDENSLTVVTSEGTELVWMDDLAVVSSDIKVNKQDTVKLMVVGPNRMQYDRIIGLLDFITKELEKIYK